jgi:hypothetical protein
LTFIICILVIVFPFYVLSYTLVKKKELDKDHFAEKFDALYEGIRTDSNYALTFNFIFLIRRLIYSIAAVLLYNSPIFQI